MKQYTFTLELSEHKETLPFYSPNDMEDVELDVTYSKWVDKGVRKIMVNKVERNGVDLHPVLMAFRVDKFFERLAEENYEFRTQEAIARNYANIHRNAMADAWERREWQRIK